MPEDRMLSVEEAFARIVSQFSVLETETVSLLDALGRVLAEDVVSAEDVPAFDNSAMDGYAVRFADTQAASEAQPVHTFASSATLPPVPCLLRRWGRARRCAS